MSEGITNNFIEYVKSKGYSIAHHDKGNHPIYRTVPELLVGVLDDITSIEGFSIGGSYANGKFKNGDDVDMDIFFDTYPDGQTYETYIEEIEKRFNNIGIAIEFRSPLSKVGIPEHWRRDLYEDHPNTPYVVRSESVARDWGLS